MIPILIVLVVIALLLALLIWHVVGDVEPEPKERFQALIVKRVIVHTKDDRSVEGILLGVYADAVSLADAYYHVSPEAKVPLDGYQVIPFVNIEWVQELAGSVDARTQDS